MKLLDIQKLQEGDAYHNFTSAIRDKETARRYGNDLETFLHTIDKDIFEHFEVTPISPSREHLSNAFIDIAKKNEKAAKNIIKVHVDEIKQTIENSIISAGRGLNKLKPIKKLLRSNEISFDWYLVDKSMPRPGKSKDRSYSRKELQKMLRNAGDLADKVIITSASSGGFRVEAWNYFTWSDLIIFHNKDDSIKGGALRVYHGDIEEYWTHITPEACQYLLDYKTEWIERFFREPLKTDPLLISTKYDTPTRLKGTGVKKRLTKIAEKIGMRPPLKEGERRHEVMIDHGMRKYQNTMFRRAKVDYADKEDMQGRKLGQEKSYERYNEKDFERFTEYQKAIPLLTISDEFRAKYDSQRKDLEISELQTKNKELVEKDEIMGDMKSKLDVMEQEIEALKQSKNRHKISSS